MLIQPDPLIHLYAIDLPTTPAKKFRATSYGQKVYFERDSDGVAIGYEAFNVTHADVEDNAQGELTTCRLGLQNATLEASSILQNYRGLIGKKVRIVEIFLSDLPDGVPQWDQDFDVVSSAAKADAVTLTLGMFSLFDVPFPRRRISDRICWRKYGDFECGYDTTRIGSLQTCDKTEDGPNGCEVHGLDEEAAGLENRHPRRALLCPGVLRG